MIPTTWVMTSECLIAYTPIEILYKAELLGTIYYGNSPIINKLKYYPAVLILILFLFMLAIAIPRRVGRWLLLRLVLAFVLVMG